MRSTQGAAADPILAARAEAAAWITRLHGPNRSAELEDGFRRWLAERPQNAAEFEGLTEVWDLVAGGAAVRGTPRLERWERSAEADELRSIRSGARLTRPRVARLSIAASLGLFALALLLHAQWPTTSYTTTVGEQRVVQLADGSTVSLNSDSAIEIDFEKGARRLHLTRGEALFHVAKDRSRPFTVTAGTSRVTALGTSFLVRLDAGRTAVTLVEGKVTVLAARHTQPSSGNARTPQTSTEHFVLSPGQRLTLAGMNPPRLDAPPLDSVTAWRRGEVVLEDTTLVEAVREMNRYDKTQIVITNPVIGALSVSGLYHTGDSEGFARSVARLHGLRLVEVDDELHLER